MPVVTYRPVKQTCSNSAYRLTFTMRILSIDTSLDGCSNLERSRFLRGGQATTNAGAGFAAAADADADDAGVAVVLLL